MMDAMKAKVSEAVERIVASDRERFREHIGPKAIDLLNDDAAVSKVAEEVYPLLPLVVRLAVKPDAFTAFLLSHRGQLISALSRA